MNIGVFEDSGYKNLLPLTWLRACFELVCGQDRLIDKLRTHLGPRIVHLWVRDSLREVIQERYDPDEPEGQQPHCLINARALITGKLNPPPTGVAWTSNGSLVAATVSPDDVDRLDPGLFLDEKALTEWRKQFRIERTPSHVRLVQYPWDLVLTNGEELNRQFVGGGVHDGRIYPGAHLMDASQIHVAPGATVKPGAVLDAEKGPIFIDRDATVQPNAVLEGPCYVGRRAIVRPGAVIRADTTIGPVCRVGGEVEATIIHGYSNKQHDGFLGHSYVAQWVNLGADTVNSDLKNTYGSIRVHLNGVGVESGQQFVGAFVADHAKTGIGTILPTGVVVGVAANVFTHRGVSKFVPSFAWLTDEGMTAYRIEKAVNLASTVMARRDMWLSDAERRLLERVAVESREVESAGWV